MARVDTDDDSIERFVVRRYAYDPERHERRHQDGHLLISAIRHGVSLPDEVMDRLDLPKGMSVLRSVGPDSE